MSHVRPDLPRSIAHSNAAAERLQETHASLRDALALPLALDGSVERQHRLAATLGLEPNSCYQIILDSAAGLAIENGAVEPFRLAARAGSGSAPVHPIGRPELRPLLIELVRVAQSAEKADRLLGPLLRGDVIDRTSWSALVRWSPVLERVGYRCAARLWDVGQAPGRSQADTALPAVQRVRFAAALASGTLSLLAAEPEARPWLVDMARTFEWRTWTPSFPYVRERSLWFTGVGAHMARAFGTAVTDRYLATLARSKRPFQAVDALTGLVAIALSEPTETQAIVASIRALEGKVLAAAATDERVYVEAVFRTASLVLTTEREPAPPPQLDEQRSWLLDEQEIATPRTFGLDAGITYLNSSVLGIAVLRSFLAAPKSAFFPQRRQPASWQANVRRSFASARFIDPPRAKAAFH